MTPDSGAAREKGGDEAVRTLGVVYQVEPLLVPAPLACKYIFVSERTWRSHDAQGLVPEPVRIGRRKLWCVAELRRWVEAGRPARALWSAMEGGQR